MTYQTSTIAETVSQINNSLFLPAIQRPFVWEDEQLIRLFDSLMKGYPISSFLLWKVDAASADNWQMYKFAEHFRFGDIHMDLVDPAGRDVTLVLDGQQRLTSLLIGLRGSFTLKAKGKRWDNPKAWQRKRLYLDLLVDPTQTENEEDSEEDIEHTYGFRLLENAPAPGPVSLWIKVGDILNCQSREQFEVYLQQVLSRLAPSANWVAKVTAKRNLTRLYEMIWQDRIISSFVETTQDYDCVLGIFVRANDGGTKLSKSDLMMSVLSSRWTDISAKEEIYNLVDTINSKLERRNNISKDFVMKSFLLLSDLDHRYNVKNFNNKNLEIMRRNWPSMRKSLVRTFKLVNRFGIDGENLTSVNALMPIAYYLHRHDLDLLDQSSPLNVENAHRIRLWLMTTLLLGVFSGQSDGTIRAARNAIEDGADYSTDFPTDELHDHVSHQIRRASYFTDEAVERLFDPRQGSSRSFLLLSLLHEDLASGNATCRVEQIFPASLVNRRRLMAQGLPMSQIDAILTASNGLGNLLLRIGPEEFSKDELAFDDWIRTRDPSFLQTHLIPPDENLWMIGMLPRFVAERERLMKKRLVSLYSPNGHHVHFRTGTQL